MKKSVKLFSILFLIFLMSGCVKYNVSMEVGKDKSVVVSIISAVAVGDNDLTNEDSENDFLTNRGFKSEEYKTDEWIGVKYSKKYDNIDDISSDKAITVELNDLLDEQKEEIKVYFQKKKSLFKTTYIAKFTADFSVDESESSSMDMSAEEYANLINQSGAEFIYDIKLPVKSDSNNATSLSDDGKTLTWQLKYGKLNNINYQFSFINSYVYIIAVALVLVILVAIICLLKKRKNNNLSPSINNENVSSNIDTNINNSVNNFIPNETPSLSQQDVNSGNMFIQNESEVVLEQPSLEHQPPIIPIVDNQNNEQTQENKDNNI